MCRRGFALVLVLWAVALFSTVTMLVIREADHYIGASHNRMAEARARVVAEGCAAVVRSRISSSLATVQTASAHRTVWESVPSRMANRPFDNCSVQVVASGNGIDINTADSLTLTNLLAMVGAPKDSIGVLVAAILDWRDHDLSERQPGLEGALYVAAHMRLPANRDFVNSDELNDVVGFALLDSATINELRSLSVTDYSQFSLACGALTILPALGGFLPEAIEELARMREERSRALDQGRSPAPLMIAFLADRLHGIAKDSLVANLPRLSMMTRSDPEYWIVDIAVQYSTMRGGVTFLRSSFAARFAGTGITATERML